MRRTTTALFVLLCAAESPARVEMFSTRPAVPGCGVRMQKFTVSATTNDIASSADVDVTPEQLLKQQWDYLDPQYAKLGLTPEKAKSLKEEDAQIDPDSIAYFVNRYEDGRLRGSMRVVGNLDYNPAAINFIAPKTHKPGTPKRWLMPLERSKEITAFLDAKYPWRAEVGRLGTDEALGEVDKVARLGAFSEMLQAIGRTLTAANPGRPVTLFAEALDKDVHRYTGVGFRVVTPEEIQKVAPGYKPTKGWNVLIFPLAEMFEKYSAAVDHALKTPPGANQFDLDLTRKKLKLLDEASEKAGFLGPAMPKVHFAKVGMYLRLGEWKAAEAELQWLEARGLSDRDTQTYRLELGIRSRLGPDNVGVTEARKWLASPEAKALQPKLRGFDHLEASTHEIYLSWLLFRTEGAFPKPRPLWQPDVDRVGELFVERFKKTVFDPETGKGDATIGLATIDYWLDRAPYALAPSLHWYRADILRKLGRNAEAESAERRAGVLTH